MSVAPNSKMDDSYIIWTIIYDEWKFNTVVCITPGLDSMHSKAVSLWHRNWYLPHNHVFVKECLARGHKLKNGRLQLSVTLPCMLGNVTCINRIMLSARCWGWFLRLKTDCVWSDGYITWNKSLIDFSKIISFLCTSVDCVHPVSNELRAAQALRDAEDLLLMPVSEFTELFIEYSTHCGLVW